LRFFRAFAALTDHTEEGIVMNRAKVNRARGFALAITMVLAAGAATALADVAPLSVSGNQIRAGGQPASFAGNSLFWSNSGWGGEKYYNANVVRWLKTDWKSNLVRAAMGVDDAGGFLQDANGNRTRVKAVVDAAIANDMYVIIDWHTHHAESYRSNAIAFFQDMARTYGTRNHVIYEIYNEPLQISWSGTIKPYAQAVISAIRAIDPDNLIVVGTPTWSQDVDVAAADPIAGTNIAYALHFYAGTHGQSLRDKAQIALNRGAALFVTEWGAVNADGNGGVNTGETTNWMNFLKARNISHANWAINDKAEGASALVPGASSSGGWPASQLTASGTLVKQIISGWGSATPPQPGVIATIQAEAFSQMSGIQTETTTDTGGGLNVGWMDVNDWLSYQNSPVTIATAGTYRVEFRVASLNGGGGLKLEAAGGSPVYGQLAVPATGGWQTWTTITQSVTLPAGTHRFGISAVSGGWNINWFRIVRP
jgi:endoglucanase